MLLRPFLNDAGSCASYLFGCTTHNKLAVVDAHADLVDEYLASAAAIGSPLVGSRRRVMRPRITRTPSRIGGGVTRSRGLCSAATRC